MKKLLIITLILALALPAAALTEFPLSENEQNYVGSWTMCAHRKDGTQYVFIITFLDNMEVIQRSMSFVDGTLTSDNKATGDWIGFTKNSIVLSLAGTDMSAMIKDDGYLYLFFFDDLSLCGIFSRCEDMTEKLGW